MAERVGVIVPTAGRPRDVVEVALTSIRRQNWPIDVVIVDDNPAGAELSVDVAALAGGDVRVIATGGVGASAARNAGAAATNATILTFCDDDDWMHPDRLSTQVPHLREARADLSVCNLRLVDEEDRLTAVRRYPGFPAGDPDAQLRYHLTRHVTGTSTYLMTRELFDQLGGFRSVAMGQEFDLMLRALEAEAAVAYLPEALVSARVWGAGGITAGPRRVAALEEFYRTKMAYLPRLTPAERRDIAARHQAAVAAAEARSGRYLRAGFHAARAVVTSPSFVWSEARNRWARRETS